MQVCQVIKQDKSRIRGNFVEKVKKRKLPFKRSGELLMSAVIKLTGRGTKSKGKTTYRKRAR